ncbi:hypothetical protein MGG_10546 [Pyricularia oryzae 70-15]|uniref:Uncharacterized protein n=1 Tax=Pyricularia oryzae (strain 70-15 / ATCC MYA-4617 / FGSC 8958) TaxID=242507 RepID=G4MKF9_PYRO7|nr:uncharacterized protein MGG_10546 [Pyricularia oryzae 70-15]EHA57548.1 hypothetical protein MGG_10546 [Pyricularia oryzae 70-15]
MSPPRSRHHMHGTKPELRPTEPSIELSEDVKESEDHGRSRGLWPQSGVGDGRLHGAVLAVAAVPGCAGRLDVARPARSDINYVRRPSRVIRGRQCTKVYSTSKS